MRKEEWFDGGGGGGAGAAAGNRRRRRRTKKQIKEGEGVDGGSSLVLYKKGEGAFVLL